jgi:hypothetical protein
MQSTETPEIYVRRGGAYLLNEHAGILIDSAGNYSAKTRGNPRSLALLLRCIADDIEGCICTPAIAGISDGPSIDCPQHGYQGMVDNSTLVAAIGQAQRSVDRYESQNAGDPFRFDLTEHRYVALRDLLAALSTPPAEADGRVE